MMQVGFELQKITEGADGDGGTRRGIIERG
jgi:hypothetical protein